ncbi:MAG: hypothetical protein HQK83_07405 [Fibrobacteria bacterium]|nr:hypothetical protein [Fibrobacteria bacterium]
MTNESIAFKTKLARMFWLLPFGSAPKIMASELRSLLKKNPKSLQLLTGKRPGRRHA